MTGRRDLARLRLAAHRLVGEPHASVAEAVRWATATQAQDLPAAQDAVALRTARRSLDDVDEALDSGAVVRSWPMRGTLHLVPAEDLGWMLTLGPPRVAAAAAARRAQLGLDDEVLASARRTTVAALSGGRRLSRDGLSTLWRDAGIDTSDYRGAHLLGALAAEGLVCLGPREGRRGQAVVLLEEWVRRPRRLERDEALAEWAMRYFRSHGPATVRDFAWWTGLTLGDARRGLAAVADSLERVEVDGDAHYLDPETPELLRAARGEASRGVLLLPAFDELLVGYRDRTAFVPAAHLDKAVAGGIFRPIVVAGGAVVGTWRRPRGAGGLPEVAPFTTFRPTVTACVPRVWAAYPRRP